MYGGQVTGGVASSFTGSYYSNGVATATKNGFGGCIYNAGIGNFYGGTVTAGSVTSITGTITEPDADYVYTQEETPLADKGDCVWNSAASVVSLGGDARVIFEREALACDLYHLALPCWKDTPWGVDWRKDAIYVK
jgi:hypothetical protein